MSFDDPAPGFGAVGSRFSQIMRCRCHGKPKARFYLDVMWCGELPQCVDRKPAPLARAKSKRRDLRTHKLRTSEGTVSVTDYNVLSTVLMVLRVLLKAPRSATVGSPHRSG